MGNIQYFINSKEQPKLMNLSLISIFLVTAVLFIAPLKAEAQNGWNTYTDIQIIIFGIK